MVIEVIKGDILTQYDLDCIVNPANGHLRHGGGLARAIADAADPADTTPLQPEQYQWRDDHRDAPLIATGDAYATSAGMLPYKNVVHAVGPIYGGGDFYEAGLLISAYTQALQEAEVAGCERVGLPAISCGIFGYPVEKAAPLALAAVYGYSFVTANIKLARFVMFSDEHYDAFTHAMTEVAS